MTAINVAIAKNNISHSKYEPNVRQDSQTETLKQLFQSRILFISQSSLCSNEKHDISPTRVNNLSRENSLSSTPLNKQGNHFQGVLPQYIATKPGTITHFTHQEIKKESTEKPFVYNALNKNGHTFHGVPSQKNLTRPGKIAHFSAPQQQNETQVKNNLLNPLNSQGNTFQGLPTYRDMTQPGMIGPVSVQSQKSAITVKNNLFNPLNSQGNTFQGLPTYRDMTLPGEVSQTSSQESRKHKALYNPLNKHGNAFQGIGQDYNMISIIAPQKIANTLIHEESEASRYLEEILSDNTPLFADEKELPDLPVTFSPVKIKANTEFKPDYYRMTYLN